MGEVIDIDPQWRAVAEVVARALAAVADRAEATVPPGGGFDAIDERFAVEHPAWTQGQVVLRVAASPELTPTGTRPGDGRYLQVRVATPSGGSETSQILVSGKLPDVLGFARDVEHAPQVVAIMRDLAATQRRLALP